MKLSLSKQKKELFIKTSIWNSIIEVFKEEKNILFEEYLTSIKINGNTIIVKTNNPLINSELLMLDMEIKERFLFKIKNLELENLDFDIKYV